MRRVFFYGLFMDRTLLVGKGFHPRVVGSAELADYRIRIGEKASLVPCAGSACYGLVIDLAESEVERLYGDPSVADYRPENVRVVLSQDGSVHDAVCYNLAEEKLGRGMNREYALALSKLVRVLGFPAGYVGEIAGFSSRRESG